MNDAPGTGPLTTRQHLLLVGTSFVLLLLFLLDLALGSVAIPLDAILRILAGGDTDPPAWQEIVRTLRLPKAVTAVLVGAGLSVSGLQMQTLFRNPLAGPFVLGINAGASLGVALVVLSASGLAAAGLAVSGRPDAWLLVLAATAGASVVLLLVAAAALRIQDSATLLIIGLMFGSATGALVSILQFFSQAERIQAFLLWTFGSLSGVTWTHMQVFAPVVAAGLVLAGAMVKPLNALLLGERYATSLGLNVRTARLAVIGSTSLLAGSVTAFCGPIAFVGLAVPHLTRALFQTTDHRVLVPFVCLIGGVLMLGCDLIAHLPGTAFALPINAVTSLFGAPVVIWVILRQRNVQATL